MSAPSEVTILLQAYRDGDRTAFDRLVPLVYGDLKQIARRLLRGRAVGQTLSATGVVHEAWLKLVDHTGANWNDRGHFLAVSARAMRQVVIDYAREKKAAKRGGNAALVTLDETSLIDDTETTWVLAVDEAVRKLGEHSEELARIVECRFFGGFSEQETADALGLSLRTVQRGWPRARAWLKEVLRTVEAGEGQGGGG